MYWNLSIVSLDIYDTIPVPYPPPTHLFPYVQILVAETMIVIHWLLLFIYYSITLDNTDMSTLGKGKIPASTNSVEAYNKEAFKDKIRKLT